LNSSDGEEIAAWRSGKNAKNFALEPGTYTLEEVKAPSGYIKGEKVEITVSEDGKIKVSGSDATLSGSTVKYENKKETTKSSKTTTKKTTAAKTGDQNRIALYLLTMLGAAIVLGILQVNRRRKNK
jgi:uncharacterized surface anchored protein